MAWLGSNLSSLKTQITNFTKEVLIEPSPENDENQKLNVEQHKQLEENNEKQKLENERLKIELLGSLEKVEASDYQAKKQSAQSKALLDSKEDEIRELRERLAQIEEQNNAKSEFSNTPPLTTSKALGARNKSKARKKTSSSSISDDGDWSDWGTADRRVEIHQGGRPSKAEAEELVKLKEEVSKYAEIMEAKEEQITIATQKIDQLGCDNESLKEKLYNAIKSEGLHIAQINGLESAIEDLKLRITGMEITNQFKTREESTDTKLLITNTDIHQGSHEIDELVKTIEQLTLENAELKTEIDKLTTTTVETRGDCSQTDESYFKSHQDEEYEEASLDLLNEQFRKEKDKLLRELDELVGERDDCVTELNVVKDKLLEAEEEMDVLEEENNDLHDKIDHLERIIDSKKLEDQVQDTNVASTQQNLENEMKATIEALKDEINRRNIELEESRLLVQNLSRQLETEKIDLYKNRDGLNELTVQLEMSKQECDTLTSRLNEIKEAMEKSVKTSKDLECDNCDLKAQIESFTSIQSAENRAEIEKLKAVLDEKEQIIRELEDQIISSNQIGLSKDSAALSEHINRASELEEKFKQMEAHFQLTLADKDHVIKTLKYENQDSADKFQSEVLALRDRVKQLCEERDEVKAQIIVCRDDAAYKADSEIGNLQTTLQIKESTIAQFQIDLDEGRALQLDYKNKLTALNAQKDELKAKLSTFSTPECKDVDIQVCLDDQQSSQLKDQEICRLQRENERLTSHLLEMEDNYASAAMASEDVESELRDKCANLETMVHTLQTQLNECNLSLGSVQSQYEHSLRQKDEDETKILHLEETVSNLKRQIVNVQTVLEGVQNEKDNLESIQLATYRDKQVESDQVIAKLKDQIKTQELDIKKFQALSKSYSFLNQKLVDRENSLADFKKIVAEKERLAENMKERFKYLEEKQNLSVEREVMKNLFMSYLNAPNEKQRIEIGFLMGKILGLNSMEIEKLNYKSKAWGWSSLWQTSIAEENDFIPPGKSLGDMFIQFLEKESIERLPPKFNINTTSISSHSMLPEDSLVTSNIPHMAQEMDSYPMLTNSQTIEHFNSNIIVKRD